MEGLIYFIPVAILLFILRGFEWKALGKSIGVPNFRAMRAASIGTNLKMLTKYIVIVFWETLKHCTKFAVKIQTKGFNLKGGTNSSKK